MLFSFAFYLASLSFPCSVKSVFLHILPFLFKLACIRSPFLFFFFSRSLFFPSDLFLSPRLILFPHVSNFPVYPHFFSFVISFFLFPALLFLLSTLKEERLETFFLSYCQERAHRRGLPPKPRRHWVWEPALPSPVMGASGAGEAPESSNSASPQEWSLSPDAHFDRKRDVFILFVTPDRWTPREKKMRKGNKPIRHLWKYRK